MNAFPLLVLDLNLQRIVSKYVCLDLELFRTRRRAKIYLDTSMSVNWWHIIIISFIEAIQNWLIKGFNVFMSFSINKDWTKRTTTSIIINENGQIWLFAS